VANRKGGPKAASSQATDAPLIMGPARRFYIDHFLFLEDPYYRRLLARVIGRYLGRVGRLHLTFMCSGGCCELDGDRRGTVNFLLSGKYADAWMKQR
jgi:hypothetical protein